MSYPRILAEYSAAGRSARLAPCPGRSFVSSEVLKEFEAAAERAREALRERSGGDRIRIQIGSATCEHAAGSRDVLDEFHKHVVASGRDDILVHRTGCTGRCSREPIVGVLIPGEMPVKYQQVDRELVHGIFTRHVLGGEPLLGHVLDGPIEKIAPHEILFCDTARCGRTGRDLCAKVLPELFS